MPPALVGVDPADQGDLDLAVQVGDQVGQLVGGAAQVDRAFDRAVEQRRRRFGEAVDARRRAGVGGELDPGADGADVGVVEELGLRQGDRRREAMLA